MNSRTCVSSSSVVECSKSSSRCASVVTGRRWSNVFSRWGTTSTRIPPTPTTRFHSASARNGFAMCSSAWDESRTSYEPSSIPSRAIASRTNPDPRLAVRVVVKRRPCRSRRRGARRRSCRGWPGGGRAGGSRPARRSRSGRRSRGRAPPRRGAGRRRTRAGAGRGGCGPPWSPFRAARSSRVACGDAEGRALVSGSPHRCQRMRTQRRAVPPTLPR